MKMKFTLAFLICTLLFQANAQVKKTVPAKSPVKKVNTPTNNGTKGHNIALTFTPYKNTWIYLGSYYGKSNVLVDSVFLNENSKGVFKGDNKYTGGIYFIVSPQRNAILFEFLMDEKQQFAMVADTAAKDKTIITGSPDNDLFKAYSEYSGQKGAYLYQLKNQLASAKNAADSNAIKAAYQKGEKELQDYRNNIITKQPNSLLAMLFNVMKRPDAPPVPIVNGKPDSVYPYRFVKDNFWNDVAFNDDRILRTPFFESKLEDYYKYYVSPEADSIIPEVKYMLLSARTGKEMFPYLLTKFTNKYVNPEFMGQDRVFLYLFNEFYSKGDTTYLNAASRKMIFERAYNLMANQIGEAAPQLRLKDTTGTLRNMYDEKGKFTLIAFWDPNCGHCKEQLPRVDSFYKAKWKAIGVKVYSVYVYDDHVPEWKKFINEKGMQEWTHVYQTKEEREYENKNNIPNFRQLYDARVTPTFYLLDENKRIIAKQLSLEQFDDVIAAKIKQLNSK